MEAQEVVGVLPRNEAIELAMFAGREANVQLIPESVVVRHIIASPLWEILRESLTFSETRLTVIDGWNIAENER